MKHLLDINVWLALTLVNHPHHRDTSAWFDQFHDADKAYFCRPTQQGFLRLATNKSVFGPLTLTNQEAVRIYRKLRSDPRVDWLDEPDNLEPLWFQLSSVERARPNLWMDAYLAAFAILTDMQLSTFDQGFGDFPELLWKTPGPK